MGKADRMTECELDYIKAVYPQIGPTEIARRLGRSLSAVKSRIRQMGLSKVRDAKTTNPQSAPAASANPRERLLELRDLLRESLLDAPPNCIASLSKEYRAVLHDLEESERKEETEELNPLEQIAKAIVNGMQAKT